MIEETQVPDINALLPPSKHYALIDEIRPARQLEKPQPGRTGWLGRLLGGGTYETADLVSLQIPTPASRYVMLMFLQMFEDSPATRTLRRSEPLPVVTFGMETAEPPALEEVLSHVRGKCMPPLKHNRGPAEGTINLTIQGTPCRVLCRFDDDSDTCCQIQLERASE
jgi:hypothetical protein